MQHPGVSAARLPKTVVKIILYANAAPGKNMEDSLRPRRAAAWTTIYDKRSSKPDQFRRLHLFDNTTGKATEPSEDLKVRRHGSSRHEPITFGDAVKDYLEKSSMHGLRYVGESNLHWVERTFWAISFLIAMATSFYFISSLYQRWEQDPVIASLSPTATQLTEIPFPAITVCNMNRAQRSNAKDIDKQKNVSRRELERTLLDDLCNHEEGNLANMSSDSDSRTAEAGKWKNIKEFMIKVAQPCQELLVACKFGGKLENCFNLFNTALTDEGMCCTFNGVHRDFLLRNPRDLSDLNVSFPAPTIDWTPQKGYATRHLPSNTVPRRPVGAGSHLGLTLVLDAARDDYYCTSTASVGFKMVLHSPVETPKIAGFGLAIAPGLEYQVEILPRITGVQSVEKIRLIAIDKRQCVFEDERYLRFYRTYTQRNCALECEANFTLDVCLCVLPYMPKDENTRICGQADEKCAYETKHKIEVRLVHHEDADAADADEGNASHGDSMPAPRCECLPACTETNYRGQATSTPLLPTNLIAAKNYLENVTDSKRFQEEMAVVHLFFTETQFTRVEKGELFGQTDFISSTGGLLGLFMGFSCLSLIEIAYNLSLKLLCSVLRERRSERATRTRTENGRNITVVPIYPFSQ